jgi:hypothetical protein
MQNFAAKNFSWTGNFFIHLHRQVRCNLLNLLPLVDLLWLAPHLLNTLYGGTFMKIAALAGVLLLGITGMQDLG